MYIQKVMGTVFIVVQYPYEYITVTEHVATFCDKCPFRVYRKFKPAYKSGFVWILKHICICGDQERLATSPKETKDKG
jgi:hypothetical protein